jgi:hypothetical protein
MTNQFDVAAIEKHGWRQGAVLGEELAHLARGLAPRGINNNDADWLILTSHDCDVVNYQLEKEPLVEVLRAEVIVQKAPDKQQVWGRNPRVLQFVIDEGAAPTVLSCRVHERWAIPRDVLAREAPLRLLDDKLRRLIAEWLAKRYIRAAFPSAFDMRWRSQLREWTSVLERYSPWIQGVYLRLSTLRELDDNTPYQCQLIVAVPAKVRREGGWASKREEIAREVEAFWKKFEPLVECVEVELLGTDELTLADIEPYQRFDADWVSFADDTAAMPATADMPR